MRRHPLRSRVFAALPIGLGFWFSFRPVRALYASYRGHLRGELSARPESSRRRRLAGSWAAWRFSPQPAHPRHARRDLLVHRAHPFGSADSRHGGRLLMIPGLSVGLMQACRSLERGRCRESRPLLAARQNLLHLARPGAPLPGLHLGILMASSPGRRRRTDADHAFRQAGGARGSESSRRFFPPPSLVGCSTPCSWPTGLPRSSPPGTACPWAVALLQLGRLLANWRAFSPGAHWP